MKSMRRILSGLLCLMLCLSLLPAASAEGDPAANGVVASGECGAQGDNLTWTLSTDGVLTISGTGEMAEFGFNNAPWYGYRDTVKELVLQPGMTNISNGAFEGFSAINTTTVPGTVLRIEQSAFSRTALKTITLSEGIKEIEPEAFFGVRDLASITLPASLESFTGSAFWDSSLQNIYVAASSPQFRSVDGVLFSKDMKTLVLCPMEHTESYTIPKEVKIIAKCAFGGWSRLKSVTIPEGVTTLERDAFACNHYLKSITIPASVTSIEEGALRWCEAMPAITVAKGNKTYCSIDGVLYTADKKRLLVVPSGKNGTLRIPDGVEVINRLAIMGTGLKSLGIPASVKELEWGAIPSNEKLKSVYFFGNAPSIQEGVFDYTTATAYYPRDNSTWTASVRQNYGGSITWKPFDPDHLNAPKITAQPESKTLVSGKTATFAVTVQGEGLTYQWQMKNAGSSKWTDLEGETKATLTFTAKKDRNGCAYRCVVSNIAGDSASEEAKLTVIVKPKITTQPKKASVKAGKKVTFKVKASGLNLKYQWYRLKPGTKKWVKISKATKATYSFKAAKKWNGYKYRCVVKNAAGSVKSKAVKLTVK